MLFYANPVEQEAMLRFALTKIAFSVRYAAMYGFYGKPREPDTVVIEESSRLPSLTEKTNDEVFDEFCADDYSSAGCEQGCDG